MENPSDSRIETIDSHGGWLENELIVEIAVSTQPAPASTAAMYIAVGGDNNAEDAIAFLSGYGILPADPADTVLTRDDIAGGLLAFRSSATKIAVEFRELDISVDGKEARVEGWIDYSGTEAAWPRHVPKSEKFLSHLEKTDGQWLFSRIKVP